MHLPRRFSSSTSLCSGSLSLLLALGCGSDADGNGGAGASTARASSVATSDTSAEVSSVTADASSSTGGFPKTMICEELGLPKLAFQSSDVSVHRGDVAGDFTVELLNEPTFTFSTAFTGCESYVFIPDNLVVSDLDDTSIWEKNDLDDLIKGSPENVHYFFVSRKTDAAAADAALAGMRARIDGVLAGGMITPAQAMRWKDRLHVVAKPASAIEGWLQPILRTGVGRGGFAIDRAQRIRGVGYLADVSRYRQALSDGGFWPWESNLAYAANEPRLYNFEATRQAELDADGATVVDVYTGDVIDEYFGEVDVALPSAAQMAGFDTLTIDITSTCPDADALEFGNCGAWDYLAYLFVRDDTTMENVEMARFITSYHRETRWVVDATPMLALLKDGGTRHFRWEFAPDFNPQPTGTKLSFRFSNKNKMMKPAAVTPLFGSADFGSMYNDRMPVTVPVSAAAKRVELWALITGHGAGTSNCAEFCNHTHEFTVNGNVHLKAHPEAATNTGCIDQTDQGMTPNQAGTWWFGRGGWCPGQYVAPYVVDVTSEVTAGADATIAYRGLLNGGTPPDGAGNIVLTSYLVVYE